MEPDATQQRDDPGGVIRAETMNEASIFSGKTYEQVLHFKELLLYMLGLVEVELNRRREGK